MQYRKSLRALAALFFVSAAILHSAAAKATAPCLPVSIYLPIAIGGESGGSEPNGMWRPISVDFNGDGCADLAIGAPFEDIDDNSKQNGGAVNILYGLTSGLTAAGDQQWDQGSDSIAGAPETSDAFGWAVTAGDFNGDRYTDLAIGVPFEDSINNTVANAGTVNIIYGSANGLTKAANQILDQGTPESIKGAPETSDVLGSALAAGDFNGDEYADLAIGVPGEDIVDNTRENGGAVNVIYGSAAGLTAAGNQFWHQGSPDSIRGEPAADERFGSALATGDFNGDGYTDLAIGVPGDNNAGRRGGGANVIYGSATGLTEADNELLRPSRPEDDDLFGAALTAGDFNGDGYADLAIGAPGEEVDAGGGANGGGAVEVFYGSANGIASRQLWDQGKASIAGVPEEDDLFGAALTAGDFNGDGYADLAIGVPGEDIVNNSEDDGGAVNVIYGSANGLIAAGNQLWDQGSTSIAGAPEAGDRFGRALTAGDYNGDGYADLAIGVPFEDIDNNSEDDGGAVNVIYGSSNGLTAAGNQIWDQGTPSVLGAAEAGDVFGASLR